MGWCADHHLDPLADIHRPHVELYARELEGRGLGAATVALKLVVLTGFYRYCVEEQLIEHSPAVQPARVVADIGHVGNTSSAGLAMNVLLSQLIM